MRGSAEPNPTSLRLAEDNRDCLKIKEKRLRSSYFNSILNSVFEAGLLKLKLSVFGSSWNSTIIAQSVDLLLVSVVV